MVYLRPRKVHGSFYQWTQPTALNPSTAFSKIASSTALGGITGLSLNGLLKSLFGLTDLQTNVILVTSFGLGYLLTEAIIVPIVARRTKNLIVKYDGLKNDYYKLYLAG